MSGEDWQEEKRNYQTGKLLGHVNNRQEEKGGGERLKRDLN